MSRVRGHSRPITLLLALATCVWTGCIFSPETGVIPPEPPPFIDSPDALIQALSRSYLTRDDALFASLLANAPDRPEAGDQKAAYLFLLSEPTPQQETQWGYQEEVRIQKRMFHPEKPDPGDPIVPTDLWMQSLQITLTPLESFTERLELYSENHGLDGKLDPDIWKASDARYSTYVLFDLTGTDYKVEGEANFVVIEDKTKVVGDAGKFLIYIWEDLGCPNCPPKPQAGNPT